MRVLDKILSSPLQTWVNERIISSGVFVIVINAIINHIMSVIFNLASTLKAFLSLFLLLVVWLLVIKYSYFLLSLACVEAKALRWL